MHPLRSLPEMPPKVCTLTPPSGFIVLPFIPLCFALWQLYRRWRLAGAIGPRQQAFISLEWSCIAVTAIVPAIFAGLPWELLHGACPSATSLLGLSVPLAPVSIIAVVFPIADVLIWPDDYVNKTWRTYLAAVRPFALSLFVFAICLLLIANLSPAHRELMFWRGLSPLSGVSPAAPFVAFAIGWLLFCLCTQDAVRLLRVDRPRLPSEADLGGDSALGVFSDENYVRLNSTGANAPWRRRRGGTESATAMRCDGRVPVEVGFDARLENREALPGLPKLHKRVR